MTGVEAGQGSNGRIAASRRNSPGQRVPGRPAPFRFLALLLAAAMTAAACVDTGDEESIPEGDPADGLQSEVVGAVETVSPDDAPNADLTPSDLDLSDRFQRLEPSQFGNESTEIDVLDGIALDADRWLAVGVVEDGGDRSTSAVAAVMPRDGGPARLVPLPSPTGSAASAERVGLIDGRIVVLGVIRGSGGPQAMIWSTDPTTDETFDDWDQVELPLDGSVESIEAVGLVAGTPAAPGYWAVANAIGSEDRALVWRVTDGEVDTIDIERNGDSPSSAAGGIVFDDGLVMVGQSITQGEDPQTILWVSEDDRLSEIETNGLPASGYLNDIEIDDDGSLVIVGSETVNARSDPIVARAETPDGRWSVLKPTIDIADWISFSGLIFRELVIEDGAYHATLTDAVVQQLSRSTDGGRTWERLGDLGAAGGNFVPANGFAIDGDEILITGGDIALGWQGTSWASVAPGQDSFPTQQGSFDAFDVVAGADGFYIGGGKTTRAGTGYEYEAVLWQSPDGLSWGRPPVDGAETLYFNDLFVASDGSVAGIKAGNNFFREAYVQRPGPDGTWVETPIPVGEAFFLHTLEGPAGAIIAAGQSPDDAGELIEPVFVVVDPDDTVRTVPLTNTPVTPASNVSTSCLAGSVGLMIAVLEWGDGGIGVATSPNGERWRGLDATGPIDRIDVSACEGDEQRGFVMAGRDVDGNPAVARSDDGADWTVETIDGVGAVFGVNLIGDVRYLTGWRQAEDGIGSAAAIWREDGDDWVLLEDTGLEPDEFAVDTSVWQLAEMNGVVVAIGSDRGRAGAWVASADALTR